MRGDDGSEELVVAVVVELVRVDGPGTGVTGGVADGGGRVGEVVGRDGLTDGPGVPGVESVKQALNAVQLLAVEPLEGGGRPVLVGGLSEVAGLGGELAEAALEGLRLRSER